MSERKITKVDFSKQESSTNPTTTKITPLDTKFTLPKPELIQGEIDFPEMIKKDFRKALSIVLLSVFTTLVVVAGLWVLLYFL